jgi:alpha-tubulin suppressor-like RCC1 family protein
MPLDYPDGHACSANDQCHSTHCTDNVCCDTTCNEQCKACNLKDAPGHCSLVPNGQPVGNRQPCKNASSICGGACSGAASCTYPGSLKICDSTSACLTPLTRLDAMACDGAGFCATSITSGCTPPQYCNVNTDGRCGLPVYTQVDAGASHTCAVVSNGTLQCWGSNDYGKLGLPEPRAYPYPTTLDFPVNVKAVTTAWGNTCALVRDGRVYCWGTNFNGDLGCPIPTTIVSDTCTTFASDYGIIGMDAGAEHTCALQSSGGIKCWGRGEHGENGDGSFVHHFSPVSVLGIDSAVAMASGIWHTCAVSSDGTVRCWGDNGNGKLGTGNTISYAVPTPVVGIDGVQTGAVAVAAALSHTCVLLRDHSIQCFGDDSFGQLGDGQYDESWVPWAAQPPMTASALALGYGYTCAVVAPDSVKCWGRGDSGTLGDGVFAGSLTPISVQLSAGVAVTAITSQSDHVCVLDSAGRVWCWGNNDSGQLGNNSYSASAVPVQALGR